MKKTKLPQIVQNNRGNWSFMSNGRQIGNYATRGDAARAWRLTGEICNAQ